MWKPQSTVLPWLHAFCWLIFLFYISPNTHSQLKSSQWWINLSSAWLQNTTIFIKRLKYQEDQLGQILYLLLECSINFSGVLQQLCAQNMMWNDKQPLYRLFLILAFSVVPSLYHYSIGLLGCLPRLQQGCFFVSTGLQLTPPLFFCPMVLLCFIFFSGWLLFSLNISTDSGPFWSVLRRTKHYLNIIHYYMWTHFKR